jgi:hypothetical protein
MLSTSSQRLASALKRSDANYLLIIIVREQGLGAIGTIAQDENAGIIIIV